jgi:hypothetical protein
MTKFSDNLIQDFAKTKEENTEDTCSTGASSEKINLNPHIISP